MFIFEIKNSFGFVHMLIETNDDRLRGQGSQYKAVCAKLEVDPVIPLLLTYGVLHPRDVQRFVGGGNQWLRRNWVDHTILLGIQDDIRLADPNSHAWDTWIAIEGPQGADSQYCESAIVKIRGITEIHNQNEIGALVEDLLNR